MANEEPGAALGIGSFDVTLALESAPDDANHAICTCLHLILPCRSAYSPFMALIISHAWLSTNSSDMIQPDTRIHTRQS